MLDMIGNFLTTVDVQMGHPIVLILAAGTFSQPNCFCNHLTLAHLLLVKRIGRAAKYPVSAAACGGIDRHHRTDQYRWV